MFKAVFVLLLLSLAIGYNTRRYDYSLSPTIPPLSFRGQYYTCEFRVPGLKDPIYSFQKLPSFLKGSASGRIEGEPDKVGNYEVLVNYKQNGGRFVGRKPVIIRVTEPQKQDGKGQEKGFITVEKNLNNIAIIPSVFTEDETVSINLADYIPGKRVWSYQYLPLDLEGTKEGHIRGRFGNKGYYSFAAVCSDEKGRSSNYIFTLNVQPAYNPYYSYYYDYGYSPVGRPEERTQLATVPVRYTCQCDPTMAAELQKAAIEAIRRAHQGLSLAREEVNRIKAIIFRGKSDNELAVNNLKLATKVRDKMMRLQAKALKNAIKMREHLKKAKNLFKLMKTNYLEHQQNLYTAIKDLKYAQKCFDENKKVLEKANEEFAKAEKQVKETISKIKKLKLEVELLKKDVEDYFDFIKVAKKNLLKAEHVLANFKMKVDNLMNQKDIANMENDIATAQFNSAMDDAEKASDDLKKANQEVFDLKAMKDQAGVELGKAKFNLNQAMNNLLVAQAAKEQSDKAIAIATAQMKERDTGPRTYIFSGCQILNYPSYSGSEKVERIEEGKAVLTSGHHLLFGGCTEKGDIKKGDLVHFEGYWKDGSIHGIRLSK